MQTFFQSGKHPRCTLSILKYAIFVSVQDVCTPSSPPPSSSSSSDAEQGHSERLILKVTLLANEWGLSRGGLSTINRTLAIHLTKDPHVEVTILVPEFECGEKDKREAKSYIISIIEAGHLRGFSDPLD